MKQRIKIAILCGILSIWTAFARAADWPFSRGNDLATAAVKEGLPADLEVVWKHTLPESGYEATAVIAAGTV
jgi:hypothetical protein